MKKINHWINGKNVAGNDYFQTTNPATGDVLAEVASGGEAEVNQAVAAAKEAFPKWANLPMKERARLMRRLGDLIDQHVPEIAAMETADTGLPIHQTKNVLIPRASHNFEFFAEVCQQMNGKTYPVDDKMLNYTLVQPVGVCALVSPLIEKMVNSAASSARSMSASSKISTGDLPPSSIEYFFRPAFFMILRPVAVPPVNDTARTSWWRTSASPAVAP